MGAKAGGTALLVVVGLVVIGSGFPFGNHPAAPGGTAATTDRHAVTTARRPAAQPSPDLAPAAGYICAADLTRPGSGTPVVKVRCPGAPVRSVTQSPGAVTITFGASLSRCAASVTSRLEGWPAGTAAGEISADITGAPVPDRVTVATLAQSGKPAVRGFSLALWCPPAHDHGVIVISYPNRQASAPVPCGIARSGRVLATVQDGSGARLESLAVTSRGCAVRAELAAAPRPGHPARIGWLVQP